MIYVKIGLENYLILEYYNLLNMEFIVIFLFNNFNYQLKFNLCAYLSNNQIIYLI